jgi:hypothetical protein
VLLLALVEALRRWRSMPVVRRGRRRYSVGGNGLLPGDVGGGGSLFRLKMANLRGIGRHVDAGGMAGGGERLGARDWRERGLHFRSSGVLSGSATLGVLKVEVEHGVQGRWRQSIERGGGEGGEGGACT